MKLKNYELAVQAFTKALALDPNYNKAKMNRANAYRILKDYEKAEDDYQTLSEEFQQNPEALIQQFLLGQSILPKVIFGNVDLKLTSDGEIKILEFGRGMQSAFVGHELTTGHTIIETLEAAATKLGLPPLYLNSYPGREADEDDQIESKITWTHLESARKSTAIKDYKLLYGGDRLKPLSDQQVLMLDDPIANLAFADKSLMHEMFELSQTTQFRPRALKFNRTYSNNLASRILTEFPSSEYFALKVPDQEGGRGVIIATRQNLMAILKFLLCEMDKESVYNAARGYTAWVRATIHLFEGQLEQKIEEDIASFMTWKESGNANQFIVEEYITNKPVAYNGSHYDATMRVGFLFVKDKDTLLFEPFTCYWKLPPQPSNYTGALRYRTISSYTDNRYDALPVNDTDREIVYQQLKAFMPNLLNTMVQFNLPESIENIPQGEKIHKANRYLHFANNLILLGQYRLAEVILSKTEQVGLDAFERSKVVYERGMLALSKKDYSEAHRCFSHAIELNQFNGNSYFRRGVVSLYLRQEIDARRDFNKAIELNPNLRVRISKAVNYFNQQERSSSLSYSNRM